MQRSDQEERLGASPTQPVGFSTRALVSLLSLILVASVSTTVTRATDPVTFAAETPPMIGGHAMEEDVVSLSTPPTWTSEPDALRYRWYRCTAEGESGTGSIPSGCTSISQATSDTHTLTVGSVGQYIRLLVTGVLGEDMASAYSATLGPVESLSLGLEDTPQFSYDRLQANYEIEAENVGSGSWQPAASSIRYRWYRCNEPQSIDPALSVPAECSAISGANAIQSSYRIQQADETYYLGVRVTASRGSASAQIFFGLAETVAMTPSDEPLIEGAILLNISGDTVFNPDESNRAYYYFENGGTADLQFTAHPRVHKVTWSWYRCTSEGGASRTPIGCALISDRSDTYSNVGFQWGRWFEYNFEEGDVGFFIRLRIEIENSAGSDYIYTATTEEIIGPDQTAPTISVDPSINADPWEGEWVSRDWGAYDRGYPVATLSYSWYSCTVEGAETDSLPDDCNLRTRSSSYRPISADVGRFLRARIDLGNEEGDVTRLSATSAAVQTLTGPPSTNGYPTLCYWHATGSQSCGRSVAGLNHYGTSVNWTSGPRLLAKSFGWWICSSPQPRGAERGDCRLVSSRAAASGWSNYVPRVADVGRYLRLSTTALNRYGKSTVYSRTYLINASPVYQPARLLFYPRILEDPSVDLPLWQDGGAWQAYGGMPGYYARVQNYIIRWLACTSEGDEARAIPADCTVISEDSRSGGETPANEYVPRSSDVGYYLRVAITANSVGGPSTAVSATTAIIEEPDPVAPTPLEDPVIFREDEEGTRYFTTTIEWDGYPAPSTSVTRWYRCTGGAAEVADEVPEVCTTITGASSLDYDVVAADVGKRLRVSFSATTSAGTATIVSATTEPVPPLPTSLPTVSAPPIVTGLAMVSMRLVGTRGSWTATPPGISYTYQWYRCNGGGAAASTLPDGCTGLASETLGYVPVSADRTKTLRLAVTATNSAGSATHWSAATTAVVSLSSRSPIASGPPCPETSDPSMILGSVLGTGGCSVIWSAYPAVVGESSSWWSCADPDADRVGNTAPSGCRRVQSNRPQYDTSYTTGARDLGRYLRVAFTATNKAGKGTIWSSTLGPVVEAPPETKPIIIFPPELYDTPEVGEWFWQDGGAWIEYGEENYPPISGYDVTWLRCSSEGDDSENLPSDCVDAQGAALEESGARSAYQPVVSDVGFHLRAGITACSRAGCTTWYSATSNEVPEPPRTAPEIDSIPDMVLWDVPNSGWASVYHGSWSGYPAPSQTQVRVYRCTGPYGAQVTSEPDGCTPVGAWETYADYKDYETLSADTNHRIRIALRATNTEGTGYWFSETSPVVPDLSPINLGGASAPTIIESDESESTLSALSGSWSGVPSPELAFSWLSCSAGGDDTPTSRPAACTVISGATGEDYAPVRMGGRFLRVMVTGTNSRGSSSRVSTAYGPILSPPSLGTRPSISGVTRVGQILTAAHGTWTGDPAYSYQWFRCSRSGRDNPTTTPRGCGAISGATASEYELQSADRNRYIRVRITATNISGSSAVFSSASSIVMLR